VCCDCWIYNTFLGLQTFVPLFMCAQVAGNWWHIILFFTTVNNSVLLFYYHIFFSILHFQNELKHFWNTMSFLSRGSSVCMYVYPKCFLTGKKNGLTKQNGQLVTYFTLREKKGVYPMCYHVLLEKNRCACMHVCVYFVRLSGLQCVHTSCIKYL
jgi:hypothetical protein